MPARPALGDVGANQSLGGPGNAPLNNLQSLFGGLVNQQDPSAQLQISNLLNQQGIQGMSTQLQSTDLAQQLQNSLAGFGLQQQGLGVQQGALAREQSFLPQLESLSGQQFGLQGQSLSDQLAALQRYYPQQVQAFQGSQAAKGATNTQGTSQGLGNMAFDYQQQLAANTRGKQGLSIQQKQADIGFQEQAGSLSDRSKNLGIAAKQLGLSETQAKQSIDNALQQLGLSSKLSSDDITNAIAQIQAGQFSNLSPILTQMFGLMGVGQGGMNVGG